MILIITGRAVSNKTRKVRATDVFKKFSWILSLEFLLVAYFTSLLMAVMICLTKSSPVTANRVLKNFAESIWNILTVIVKQEKFVPTSHSMRICWFSLSFVIFVITQGYVFNLISTDLVNIIPEPQVEYLSDLEKPKNLNLTINLFKGQVARSYFLSKPLDSLEKRLLNRENAVDLATTPIHEMILSFIYGLKTRSTAFVASKATFLLRFELGSCMIHDDFGKERYISKQTFGSGLTTTFTRKIKIRPMAMRYLNYRNMVVIESGLFKKMWDRVTELAIEGLQIGFQITHKTYMCLEGIEDKETLETRLLNIRMQIWALTTSVYFLAGGCFIACILVILEIDTHRCVIKRHVRERSLIVRPKKAIIRTSHFSKSKNIGGIEHVRLLRPHPNVRRAVAW